MPDDFGLLFQSIAFQRPAGLQRIVIAAKRMATQHQIPASPGLSLPDVRHLVDEVPLQVQVGLREIVAIAVRSRVEVQVTHRRHRDAAGLEGKPPASADAHGVAVDRRAKDRPDQRNLTRGQRPFAADRADVPGRDVAQLECSMCSE